MGEIFDFRSGKRILPESTILHQEIDDGGYTEMEQEFSELGVRTFEALEFTAQVAGTDAAEETIGMHSDINEFILSACERGSPDIIENHLAQIRADLQHLLDIHIGAILESAEYQSE